MTQGGKITKTKDGYEALFTRELRHPPERVWAMLTEPERISLWYVRCEIEPRLGGKITEYHMHAGEDAIGRGTITRFDPPHVFEHTWWEDEYAEANVVCWELHPTKSGTRLVLKHRFPEIEGASSTLSGWHIFIEILGDVLDGADPQKHALPRGELQDAVFVETAPGRGAWAERSTVQHHYEGVIHAFLVTHPDSTRGMITGTVGMTIHVNDMEQAKRFWEALGLKVEGSDGALVRLAIPGSAPITLHTWNSVCATNGGRPPGTVTGLMLAVDDASAACARVTQAGGRIVAPPFTPWSGGMWAIVADPDGNEFIVCAPP